MRYRLAFLMLFALLPMMHLLAAPAPDPSAILDIGPPPKGETADQYHKRMIGAQTGRITLCDWMSDPEVKKLPSVARFKDPRPWLAKNLRITEEDGDRRLRFTFRDGKRSEQVVILNGLLRATISARDEQIKARKECLRIFENTILDVEKRIKTTRDPREAASYRDGINELRSIRIPEVRADSDRLKQIIVIKWAR